MESDPFFHVFVMQVGRLMHFELSVVGNSKAVMMSSIITQFECKYPGGFIFVDLGWPWAVGCQFRRVVHYACTSL